MDAHNDEVPEAIVCFHCSEHTALFACYMGETAYYRCTDSKCDMMSCEQDWRDWELEPDVQPILSRSTQDIINAMLAGENP